MFGKGGFEGNFRTTPNQSIRGASKGESKEELLRRAQGLEENTVKEESYESTIFRRKGEPAKQKGTRQQQRPKCRL